MCCKTPVITSNVTSIPEVTANSCLLINPLNKGELEEALVNLLNNPDLRNTLSKKGYERSLQFSWKNTAIKTLEAYKKIYTS